MHARPGFSIFAREIAGSREQTKTGHAQGHTRSIIEWLDSGCKVRPPRRRTILMANREYGPVDLRAHGVSLCKRTRGSRGSETWNVPVGKLTAGIALGHGVCKGRELLHQPTVRTVQGLFIGHGVPRSKLEGPDAQYRHCLQSKKREGGQSKKSLATIL